jgi:hypothetical protein
MMTVLEHQFMLRVPNELHRLNENIEQLIELLKERNNDNT